MSAYFGKQWLSAESECVLVSSGCQQKVRVFWQAVVVSRR